MTLRLVFGGWWVRQVVSVQAQLTGEGKITGEAKLTVGITSQFTQLVERAENAIKLAGQYVANGVGSTGRSSPDAAAPAHAGSMGNSPL